MNTRNNTIRKKTKMDNQLNDADVILKIMEMIEKNDAKNAENMAKNDEVHKEIIKALESIKTVTITEKNNTYTQSIEQSIQTLKDDVSEIKTEVTDIKNNMPQKAGVVISHWNTKFEAFERFVKTILVLILICFGVVAISKALKVEPDKVLNKIEQLK
jgi:deoxyribodipyrimidine photolyase